jgi:uridine kinase
MNILQIAGGEGSGKTTLATRLAEQWKGVTTVMPLERYLRNRRPTDGADFRFQPTSIDWPLVSAHIDALLRGERITIPEYDPEVGHRLPSRQMRADEIQTPDVLIVSGLYFLRDDIESLKIFVEAPAATRLERIRQRDLAVGQHSAAIFETVIELAYLRYTEPLRANAELVLDGTLPVDKLTDELLRFVAARWSSWD